VMAPAGLELAGLEEHAALLRDLTEICDELTASAAVENTRAARKAARRAAWEASCAASWDVAWDDAWDVAWAAASGARKAAREAGEVWQAAWDAAWVGAVWAAGAGCDLKPTAAARQLSAVELIDRMIEIDKPAQSIVST